jgi:iron complex transport system ATP-binding protein
LRRYAASVENAGMRAVDARQEFWVQADEMLCMEAVDVWVAEGFSILREIDWTVNAGEHWALIGPNGSGKSTLLSLAAAVRHPSAGRVTILGETLGQTDVWQLRERIGTVNPAMPQYDWFTVTDVVLTGATGTIQPRWDCYGAAEHARAAELLALLGCERLAEREIGTCSQGERQRVRIARALMPNPPFLLLDEPATGLDLPAREALIVALSELANAQPRLATIVVSHHLEELPPTTTHALLLRDGQAVANGEADVVLTSERISRAFGFDVRVHRDDGRWNARATASWRSKTVDRRPV